MRYAILAFGCSLLANVADAAPTWRPLPTASQRTAATGPTFHVDATKGDDTGAGDAAHPWRTVSTAIARLKPGDTLYLHAGVYYEAVAIRVSGKAGAPISIRSAPGEIAVIDAGLREPTISSKHAWEPAPGGVRGEYRTTKAYPELGSVATFVSGSFADTMVPLHPYKFDVDLRTDNPYWNLEKGTAPGHGIFVGPGLWFDPSTQRVHVRLASPKLTHLVAYDRSSDPRTMPLVVGTDRSAIDLEGVAHVRLQDLVLRGSSGRTLQIANSQHVEIDGLTVYGGAPAVHVRSTDHLRFVRSTVRGLAGPWSSRASMKYRGNSPYLFFVESKLPQSEHWEVAYNEMTDSHDGVVIDSVKDLRFHHNRLDNFNDDAIYLTLTPRDAVPVDVRVFENVVTRAYTVLAFGQRDEGAKPAAVGPGVYVFRNVFDLREGTYNRIPTDAAADASYRHLAGRMCGDHGGPLWEPLFFYQNTVVLEGAPWRGYYGAQLIQGIAPGTKRRLFNNIFVQMDGAIGAVLPAAGADLAVDANLLWSMPGTRSARVPVYPKGSGAKDLFVDPKLVAIPPAPGPLDVRLSAKSPAIDAGVALPSSWPDSRRKDDKKQPDLGALPLGAHPLVVGPAAGSP